MNDKMRQRLKKIRLDEGMTQEEQAEFLGVSYEYYKRIESGTRAVSIGFIESITNIFKGIFTSSWDNSSSKINIRDFFQ